MHKSSAKPAAASKVSATLCCRFGLAALLLFHPLTALAGPPFVTDDPDAVKYQHWEFYVATEHAETSQGWSGISPMFEVNYGAVPDVQLHLIAPLAYDAPAQGEGHYSYGDTEIGMKYRFIHETDRRPQASIFPLLEIPTGEAESGLGSGHIGAFLPLWLQKSWGKKGHEWTSYGGGGYHINPGEGNRDYGMFGAVLLRQVCDDAVVGGEIYHRMSTQAGEDGDTAFNLGTVIDFGQFHHLLFSAGRSIDGPTEFQTYLAYQLTFGPDQ
jgi:hypothetical protein